MIGKLEGTFSGTHPDGAAILMVSGVGYAVYVPLSVLVSIQSNPAASLFIHTAVREDALDLYGFLSHEDLSFFKQLIGISGIGPRSALGILNVADTPTLKRSIAAGDNSMLTKVFGIGKKSAERIVVELRDKLADQAAARGEAVGMGEDGEVIEALMALGYSASESRRAIKEIKGASGVSERISAALKYLGKKSS
ncbi:MAG: holliday junction DNA helicase RuvA [Parcubacteria group bacterium Gr01-1014_56]|nr:MAG: holliday junction DNA helicase RuvA [Parcubacteria group bacterium Gr01-1014_56]